MCFLLCLGIDAVTGLFRPAPDRRSHEEGNILKVERFWRRPSPITRLLDRVFEDPRKGTMPIEETGEHTRRRPFHPESREARPLQCLVGGNFIHTTTRLCYFFDYVINEMASIRYAGLKTGMVSFGAATWAFTIHECLRNHSSHQNKNQDQD